MTKEDVINNVIDELERAIQRIEEIGEFSNTSITGDEELVTDMIRSKDRLYQIICGLDIIED